MSLFQRFKNLWFFSGISKEEMMANPHSFIQQHLNLQTTPNGYIIGLNEEEQSFADSINKTVDVKLD